MEKLQAVQWIGFYHEVLIFQSITTLKASGKTISTKSFADIGAVNSKFEKNSIRKLISVDLHNFRTELKCKLRKTSKLIYSPITSNALLLDRILSAFQKKFLVLPLFLHIELLRL